MLLKVENSDNTNNLEVKEIKRHSVNISQVSKQFYNYSIDFSKQYAHIYSARLNAYRNILSRRIIDKWGDKYPVLKLCELREKGQTCIVIGTLFKHQELKPSILKEISDQLEIVPQTARTHFVHDNDTLVLEDDLQRIKLSGSQINIHEVVTGVVCAVLGYEEDDGILKIEDVCWAHCNVPKNSPTLEDRYVVIMSGLNMSSHSAEHYFQLHLMLEWLTGLCGNNASQNKVAEVIKVIIAGGLFNSLESGKTNESNTSTTASHVDSLCSAISQVVPLDLMPGSMDPSGIMLPQKPFHHCLFPKSLPYKSFNRVTNPHETDIAGLKFLGNSGEPSKDILRYSNIDSSLKAMELTLQWGHQAPTAPDTLPAFPCIDADPFIIDVYPAVYFMGNAKTFATNLYKGIDGQNVRVICIPAFFDSHTIAVVNLRTLECSPLSFS